MSFPLEFGSSVLYPDQTTFTPSEAADILRVYYGFSAMDNNTGFYLQYRVNGLINDVLLPEGTIVIHESGTPVELVLDASATLTYDYLRAPLMLQAGQTITLKEGTQITLPATTLVAPVGDQFLATPYEVWGEMTEGYTTAVMTQCQSLGQALDHKYALQTPAFLAVIWQAHLNGVTPTHESL